MEPVRKAPRVPEWFASYAHIRTDGYVMLASLLGQPPSEELLHIVRNLVWEESLPENFNAALKALRQAERDTSPAAMEEEFNRLFVGLGRGEMLPYASWYRECKVQSHPLASLRADLVQLGIVRQTDCHEPEDSAGPLCEIMALISQKAEAVPSALQAKFFQTHIASWMPTFFRDLQSLTRSEFYRAVGSFGACFLEAENEYLKDHSCQNSLHESFKHTWHGDLISTLISSLVVFIYQYTYGQCSLIRPEESSNFIQPGVYRKHDLKPLS